MSDLSTAALRVADEDDLCRLWAARALPATALITTGGDCFDIVYPGYRNGASGPDFRGAILATDAGYLRTGDVEVHLRARDWITHGHRSDPAYNGVVLHVVLDDDGAPCLRADGKPVPVLALGAVVTTTLTATATAAAADTPIQHMCRVSSSLSLTGVRGIVHAAGKTRLNAKAAAMEAQIDAIGAAQALFAGLLDAAGYSRNRLACGLLAERLPVERIEQLLAGKAGDVAGTIAMAILLGQAGLLAPADRALNAVWTGYADMWPLPSLRADTWVRASVRPANHPEARLRGVAMLLARHAHTGLTHAVLAPVHASDAEGLLASLEVPDTAGAGAGTGDRHTPPIGRGRAVAMAVNVAVPFALAMARISDDRERELAAWRTVAALPGGEDSEPLRYMRQLLTQAGHTLRAPSALEQQGLLHLHRTYCRVHACWECPLAAR